MSKEAQARIKIFWNLQHGNSHVITVFPAPDSMNGYSRCNPDPARLISETGHLTSLNGYPAFGMSDFKAVPPVWRTRIPEYVKDYVPLNQFM